MYVPHVADDHTVFFNILEDRMVWRATKKVRDEMQASGMNIAGPSKGGGKKPTYVKLEITSTSSGGGQSVHTIHLEHSAVNKIYHYPMDRAVTDEPGGHKYAAFNLLITPFTPKKGEKDPAEWETLSEDEKAERRQAYDKVNQNTLITKRTTLPFMLTIQEQNEQRIRQSATPVRARAHRSSGADPHYPVQVLTEEAQDNLKLVIH